VTVKTDGAWARVPVASHGSRSKNVGGGKNSLGGDDSFDRVGRVEALLPMDGAICQSQRKVTHLCTTIVERRRTVTMERNSDRERGNCDHVSKKGNVTGEADVGSRIHKRPVRFKRNR
jgi:hypothetical protein